MHCDSGHTTENRGVPSSSLGLAIKEGPATGGAFSSLGVRDRGWVEIHPVRHPSSAQAVWGVMRERLSTPDTRSDDDGASRQRAGTGARGEIPNTRANAGA